MESLLLPIMAFFSVVAMVVVSHASPSSEVYWKLALPKTPMPKAIKDLLHLGDVSSIKVQPFPCTSPHIHGRHHQESSNNTGNFFLQIHLHETTKMKLYFTNDTTATPFLPPQLTQPSTKPNSGEDERPTKEECEQETSSHCATSLETLTDFITSKIGRAVKLLINEVKTGSQEYEFGKGVKMVPEKNPVVCHKLDFPYAVFYCHTFKSIRIYRVPLMGGDGRLKAQAMAVCHTDTSAWHPQHLAFQVLKVMPGTTVCHFLSNNDMVWTPGA